MKAIVTPTKYCPSPFINGKGECFEKLGGMQKGRIIFVPGDKVYKKLSKTEY